MEQVDTLPPAASTVGGRIKQARNYARLDQSELGALIRASRTTVSNWERNTHSPTALDLLRIARATGFRSGWFLDGLEDEGHTVIQRYRATLKAA